MSHFQELLEQLKAAEDEQSVLAKAIPQQDGEDDETIQAAAEEAEADDENPEDEDDGDGEEVPMTKSLMVGDEEVELVDAAALIKSVDALTAKVSTQEDVLAKGLTSALNLIKSQGELIKSLQADVVKLGGKGAGRKAVLSVHEKPAAEATLAKSQSGDGMTPGEFLAKSHAAFEAKKITGKELTTIDVAIRSGQAGVLDAALINKVIA